jgi:hypothetical protein
MGARPYTAHSQHEYARLLHIRARPGDAERAAALARVLGAAGLDDRDTAAMLPVAASGLRAAVRPETAASQERRLALLDQWLSSADPA